MEVGRDIPRPKPFLNSLLIQQVEEQSEVCDLTVKVGQWKKKFHRCVLTASPFFENAINGNFLEKRRGIVEMSSGSPKCVEMALMFLYGEEPNLTIDTVGDMLEMAEFLMINSLKYRCIRWLRNLDITQENCMHVLQVSSLFDFEVTRCIEYIESHLSEVLKEKGAIHLSKDSIQYLFSDPRFSYVTSNERLKFLVKWFHKHPEMRKQNVNDLFKTIGMSEVSQTVWEDTKLDILFNEAVDLDHAVRVPGDENSSRAVWIMTGSNNAFWCLDFKKNKWYRLNSEFFQYKMLIDNRCTIAGIKRIYKGCSEIYFANGHCFKATTLNLNTNETNTYELCSSYGERKNFRNIIIKRKTVIACDNVTNYIVSNRKSKCQPQMKCTTNSVLYRGRLSTKRVKMTPILSLLDEEISKMCIGHSSVALLLKSKQAVIIFDLADYQLEKVGLSLEEGDTIIQDKDGFLIFNNKRCHCLARLSGPSLSKKYLLEEIELEKKALRYIFSRGIWLRLVRGDCTDDLKLQYVSHQNMFAGQCTGAVDWKELSMPQEIEGLSWQILKTNLFLVRLSRSKLRCHIVCPHCDARKTPTKVEEWRDPLFDNSEYIYSHEYEDEIDLQIPYHETDSRWSLSPHGYMWNREKDIKIYNLT